MTACDLLRFRLLAARRGRPGSAAALGIVFVAATSASAWLCLRRPAPSEGSLAEASFWAGMILASFAGFLSLDRGLLSDEPPRLVALGIDPGAVARYHVGRGLAAILPPLLVALGAAAPWMLVAGPAPAVRMLVLLVLPGTTAAVLGCAAHAMAGEALDAERALRLKRALGGKFGDAEAAPILYSGGAALGVTGVGAVLLQASLRDVAGEVGPGPLAVVAAGHAVAWVVAIARVTRIYRESFDRIVPRILEVAAPLADEQGGRPATVRSAGLAARVAGLRGAIAWRDLTQVRRAHRLDLWARVATVAGAAAWVGTRAARPGPLLLGATWGLVVAFILPVAARAAAPRLAPAWVTASLALRARGDSLVGGTGATLLWDAPVLLALGLLLGPLAAIAALAFGLAAHASGRLLGPTGGRGAAVLACLLVAIL